MMKLAKYSSTLIRNWTQKRPRLVLAAAVLVWATTIAVGLVSLHNYETTAGRVKTSLGDWPGTSRLQFTPGIINIVMFAHPRCPCSRSSVDELQELVNRIHHGVNASVLFWTPREAGADWTQTELWRRAATIPGCLVQSDENGVEAQRFGAATSGHVLIFRGDGTRIFSGGLTAARGKLSHGDTAAAVSRLVEQMSAEPRPTSNQTDAPVFGCPLFSSCGTNKDGAESCLK